MTKRREFLGALGAAAVTMNFDAGELRAGTRSSRNGGWDTSWLDQLATAKYRVVINANEVSDGVAMEYASVFFDHYHEAHGTQDSEMRPVIVFRRMGTVMALNDAMWDKYEIGKARHVNDSATKAPARRNVFWKAPPNPPEYATPSIESLKSRGLISLICNIAMNNVAGSFAEQFKLDPAEVKKEVKANLNPGTIVVPSGIYALMRAQNAGCAFMQQGA